MPVLRKRTDAAVPVCSRNWTFRTSAFALTVRSSALEFGLKNIFFGGVSIASQASLARVETSEFFNLLARRCGGGSKLDPAAAVCPAAEWLAQHRPAAESRWTGRLRPPRAGGVQIRRCPAARRIAKGDRRTPPAP